MLLLTLLTSDEDTRVERRRPLQGWRPGAPSLPVDTFESDQDKRGQQRRQLLGWRPRGALLTRDKDARVPVDTFDTRGSKSDDNYKECDPGTVEPLSRHLPRRVRMLRGTNAAKFVYLLDPWTPTLKTRTLFRRIREKVNRSVRSAMITLQRVYAELRSAGASAA